MIEYKIQGKGSLVSIIKAIQSALLSTSLRVSTLTKLSIGSMD